MLSAKMVIAAEMIGANGNRVHVEFVSPTTLT
jgi:hypothetical protein